jgi:trimeric autotransporter adhesin
VATSARRFKENIQPMDKLSEALFLLNPVAFRYKKEIDPKGIQQLGLVAEEVEKVNPELVVHDKKGKPYTVRYDQVNAMLLNEFLKEHKKVQQLEAASAQQRNDFEATIAELRKEIAGVVARSKNQDGKIQKVSAQVELNKTFSRTVANK